MKRLILTLALVMTGATIHAHSTAANLRSKLSIIVPAYFYPSGNGLKEWDRLLASKGLENVTIILDPDNGPGKEADPNYTALIDRAKKTPANLIGYVTTGYANRSPEAVKSDIDRWMMLYPSVHGIFLDEQASGGEHVEYYAALYAYIRKEKKLKIVVSNPGTVCVEQYFLKPTSDVACLFEGLDKPDALVLPEWASKYRSKTFVLPYGVSAESRMRSLLEQARSSGIGWIYVTDAAGANPWRRLPSYWEAEVDAVMTISRRK